MTNLEIPEMIKKAIEKRGWGDDFEYFEASVNGLTMRTVKRYSSAKDTYENMIFPAYGPFAPKLRFDWEFSAEVVREEPEVGFEEHMSKLVYFQLMQDLFEILEVVAENNVSKDLYKPVIPESVWA